MSIRQLTLFISLIILGLPAISRAQFFIGLEAGGNKNSLITNNSNQAFTSYDSKSGISVGVPILYELNDWFALKASPSYMQKNYTINRTGFFNGIYQDNINGYLQLPLMGQFSFGEDQLKGYVNLGVYGAYWLSGKVKGAEANVLNPVDSSYTTVAPSNIAGINNLYPYNEKYTFNPTKDNRMEFGWIAGIGISYETNNGNRFFIEGRRTYSFTDQQKKYMINQTPRYNDTYGINVGFLMSLDNLSARY